MFSLCYRNPISHSGPRRVACTDCNKAWAGMPASKNQCSPYAAAGVVCKKGADVQTRGPHGRYIGYNPKGANEAFIFG